MSDAEGFLSRWSRRKRAATQPPAPEPVPPEATPEAAPLPEFDPTSLPPVESLTLESDLTAFLRAEVPAALRQAALRRMWSLDPAIRDYIGPADYAWDFNAPDGVPGFALELGGDVKRLLAQAIGLGEEPEAEAPSPPEAPAAPLLAETAPPPSPEVPTELPAMPLEPPAAPPRPRRAHGSARPA